VSVPTAPQTPPGVQGGIVWALVLFENEAPFRASDASGAGGSYPNVRSLAQAVRSQQLAPEFTVEIGAKVRPVLLLQDRPQGRLPEYAALKLTRLAKLDPADLAAIRAQQVNRFFYIPDPTRYGLHAEFAVDLLALTRVHQSAIVAPPRAQVNANEFRVICERLVDVMDLDIAYRVVKEASDLLKRQGWTPPGA
jgi:hypothetical protein